jgi:hypothetical protein
MQLRFSTFIITKALLKFCVQTSVQMIILFYKVIIHNRSTQELTLFMADVKMHHQITVANQIKK